MKKPLLLLPLLSLLFLFSGCLPKQELKESSIVQAIGIDVGSEKSFAVTLQTYTPKSSGSGASISTSENNAGILMAEGDTISEAVHNAVLSGGKKLFTGYNRLIVVGRELATKGIQPIFSYFDRSTATRQNVDVLMSDTTAKDIVSVDIKEGILAAEMIEKMLDDRTQNGFISNMPYYQLSKNMYLYHGAAVLPLIERIDGGTPEEGEIPSLQKVTATRSAIFSEYRFTEELKAEETRGSVLLHDQLEETVLVAKQPNGRTASVQIYQCKQILTPILAEGKISFLSTVEATGTLDEVLDHNPDDSSFAEWEKSCEQVLAEELHASFQKIVQQSGADVLYLEELVRRESPTVWAQLEEQEENWLPQTELITRVQVNINRIGMQTDREVLMQ